MRIAEQLRWLRENALPSPLTQVELGQRMERNQTFVSEYEREQRYRLNFDDVACWAAACGYRFVVTFPVPTIPAVIVSSGGMRVADQLRWLRENARPSPLTQVELGQRMERNQTFVSEHERGQRYRLNFDDVARWAEACGYGFAPVFLPGKDAP